MACLSRVEMTWLKCTLLLLLLCLSGCFSQRDCTGVDCPVLNNCIQEVLESGACCASCVTTGCTCEGYQYYDCVNAGFKNGKVPEGESYFVDYGSTECSCPEGGGRISCHFISCPEIPANCIEVSEPADGCMQCERIGCVHNGQKYEAGHSFHMDPCKVCHCPNEGGKLMCYPVPDCDPSYKPMLASQTEENAESRHHNDPYVVDQQGSVDHFSKPYRLMPNGNLPLFKPSPEEEEEEEDEMEEELEEYDYGPTDLPEPHPDTLAFPTESTAITNRVISVSRGSDGADRTSTHQSFDRRTKQELRERYGVHEHTTDRVEVTDSPMTVHQSTARPFIQEDTTTTTSTTTSSTQSLTYTHRGSDSQIHPGHPLGNSESQLHPKKVLEGQTYPQRSSDRVMFPLHRGSEGQKHPLYPQRSSENTVHLQRTPESKTHAPKPSDSVVLPLHPLRGSESQIYPLHPARGTENQTYSQRGSDSVILPWFPLRNPESPIHPQADSKSKIQVHSQVPVTPYIHYTDEEEVDEGNEEEEEQEEEEERIVTLKDVTGPEGRDVPYDTGLVQQERNTPGSHTESDGSNPVSYHEKTTVEPSTKSPRWPEHQTLPTVHFSPTSQPPLRVNPGGGHHAKKQPQTLFNLHTEDTEELEQEERKTSPIFLPKLERGPGAPAEDVVESCCEYGQRWAAENHRCHHMPLLNNDKLSVCSVAQKQCCSGFLKENQCILGMTVARGGDVCEVNVGDQCTDDSYQVCCSCCALGLRVRSEGQGCNAHQYLGYPCGHVFLTCCEEEDSQQPLRKKEMPRPTAMPRKVSDRKFPKEAFSIDATDEAANSVEEPEDVDECQLYQGQLCQHTCINTWGSYQCGCHVGYVLQQDGHSCTPVSPEEDNRLREDNIPARDPAPPTPTTTTTTTTTSTTPVYLNPCAGNGPCSQQCTVVSGQARCSCFPGFSLMADERMCEDVNECRTGTHSCSHGDFCVNKQGSFQCVDLNEMCEEGFTNNMNSECVDVNECVTNTHSCQPSERCVNTVGSFVCERQVTCPAGYQLRNGVCEDIDECMVRTHNCGVGFECKNTEGFFLCNPKQKCLTGFTQDPHGNCIDINECSSLSEPCRSGFNCINTVGSYTCQRKVVVCGKGYHSSADGAKCVDMDECQLGVHHCGAAQICHNLPGSYRCDCQTGYQYDVLRKVCTDVNECWRYPGRLCAQTCENTAGSYHCSCTAGFSLAFDGKNCEDVNECDKSPCSQECANIYGSYQCYCRQGFYLKEDGHTCEDIDECFQSIGNLCAFQCVNVPGSYQCACPPHGYTISANGRTCRDIDECTTGSHNCSLGQTCYNIQGSHRCLSFDCPQNYKKMSDTRCERTSCPSNSLECQNSPLRITYYQLSFQTNIIIPAQIFRIGPSPAYSGDHIVISITKGNEEGYFSTRKLNSFTGAVYLQRQVREPKDFLIDVEMKLLRQGTLTSFLARIYVFITASSI